MIKEEFQAHQETLGKTMDILIPVIEKVSKLVVKTLKGGNKVLLCGNGGSAADAQHIAAELTGRYKTDRKGLAGVALTTDTSALTAIGNDFGYDRIFERQIEALGIKGDLLIGISTSGNSVNIINAFKCAKKIGCNIMGMSGRGGGLMNAVCDLNLVVPSDDTPRIQEMHILLGHIICQAVDDAFI
ncbi:MAG: D-sedoheptulose 7-phosphate isomerase [Desulfobacula sp.]|nr:D-sedoheptulose 7-phosphate isomerase [Desulfobacula sp.]